MEPQRPRSKAEERAQLPSRRGSEEGHIDGMLAVMTFDSQQRFPMGK
jgi:hypothetical protein